MKVAVLFSGGKDSTYALYWVVNQGWSVEALVSLKPGRDDSYMFHKPCIEFTGLQAEAMGLPIVEACVSGEKEVEVEELEGVLSGLGVDGIVSGAVASEYQRTRIDRVCEKLGFKSFAPLWHKRPHQLMRDIFSAGFQVMVVGVAAQGLGEDWLGRILGLDDLETLGKLSEEYGVSVCGEGGEFETLVLDGPLFKRKIIVKDFRRDWSGQAGSLVILEAGLS
ncbi:MAG: diphthine--ammonia ligase [Candidatus Altiarchaeota archaeon]